MCFERGQPRWHWASQLTLLPPLLAEGEESAQLQLRDTFRILCEAGCRGRLSGYGFISFVLFLATPNHVTFRCTTSVSGCVGGRLLPGEEVGWCAE